MRRRLLVTVYGVAMLFLTSYPAILLFWVSLLPIYILRDEARAIRNFRRGVDTHGSKNRATERPKKSLTNFPNASLPMKEFGNTHDWKNHFTSVVTCNTRKWKFYSDDFSTQKNRRFIGCFVLKLRFGRTLRLSRFNALSSTIQLERLPARDCRLNRTLVRFTTRFTRAAALKKRPGVQDYRETPRKTTTRFFCWSNATFAKAETDHCY